MEISLGGTRRSTDDEPASGTASAERQRVSPAEMAEQERQRSRLEQTMGQSRVAAAADGPPQWVWWTVIGLLAATAGFVGWWIGTRGDAAPPPPTATTLDADAAARTKPADDAPPEAGDEETSDTAETTEETPARDAADGVTAEAAEGTLVLRPPPWTDAMIVQVDGGVRRALDGEIRLELAAGRHRVDFELAESGYSVQRTRTIDLAAGGQVILLPPVEEPGFLVVRPRLRTPQALATLDDGEPMATPLNGIPVAPGEHRLALRPRDGGGQELSRSVVVRSGERTVVNFDLDARTVDVIE